MNKRIRNINSIIDYHEHEKYLYSQKLSSILGPDLTKECESFIENLKEARYLKVLVWQNEKFERLWCRKQDSANIAIMATQNRWRTNI